jgi:hypothetical protein
MRPRSRHGGLLVCVDMGGCAGGGDGDGDGDDGGGGGGGAL